MKTEMGLESLLVGEPAKFRYTGTDKNAFGGRPDVRERIAVLSVDYDSSYDFEQESRKVVQAMDGRINIPVGVFWKYVMQLPRSSRASFVEGIPLDRQLPKLDFLLCTMRMEKTYEAASARLRGRGVSEFLERLKDLAENVHERETEGAPWHVLQRMREFSSRSSSSDDRQRIINDVKAWTDIKPLSAPALPEWLIYANMWKEDEYLARESQQVLERI